MRIECRNYLSENHLCEMCPPLPNIPRRNPVCCAYCKHKIKCYTEKYSNCKLRVNDRFCEHLKSAIKATDESKFLFAMDALELYRKEFKPYESKRKVKAH